MKLQIASRLASGQGFAGCFDGFVTGDLGLLAWLDERQGRQPADRGADREAALAITAADVVSLIVGFEKRRNMRSRYPSTSTADLARAITMRAESNP